MIFEIPKESFRKIQPLIGEFSHYLVLGMLLDGRTPAKIWANHPEKPTTALVWDRLNTLFFLLGDSSNRELNQVLNSLIMNELLPEAIQLQYRKFFLQFGPHHAWMEQKGVILEGVLHEQRFIHSYALDPKNANHIRNLPLNLPAGYQLAQVTAELLENPELKNLDRIAADISACWQSTDQYLKNGGIGYCLLKGDVITSWCSTDYVIENECELYIETFEGYQRTGLGTQVGLGCVQACIAKGLIVRWHCFDYAIGSIKIAEKIHLIKTEECPVYIVDLSRQYELNKL